MHSQPYTLAMYRVKPGKETAFISAWHDLATIFSSLRRPPIWGTLIRHRTDRTLFYSFGPWNSLEDVKAMREDPQALAAFQRIGAVCVDVVPGDYEVVVHVDVPHPPGA
jgi:heme-degrading monooxygenase HmoA